VDYSHGARPLEVACGPCGKRQKPSEKCSECGKSLTDPLPVGRALAQIAEVEGLIEQVRQQGHETAYFEIAPYVARLGLETRWDLPEHERHRPDYVDWALERAAEVKGRLEEVLAGKRQALVAPPIPDYSELELRDGYLRLDGELVFLFGINGGGPPHEEQNRAKWYDFARFNCWRFTDYMSWVRDEVRKIDPSARTCTGAPAYMLSGQMGWAGIDEEALDRVVNDAILNESRPSTMTTDLLRSLSLGGKLLQDPEYHGDIAHIMAHFLHGDGRMSMWWWPRRRRPGPPSFYRTDIGRSPHIPLDDVATCLRSALDVRRLSQYIVPFHKQTEEVVLLYSHDSMLQVPPELRNSRSIPHVFAMKTVYEGTVYLDAPTRFVTERQIEGGRLGDLKLLILPAVEYQNPTTQARILDWVRDGGTLVLTPSTWLGDEYARPAEYLSELGLRIKGMALPEVRVTEARPDIERGTGFIMGAVSEVELEKVPKSILRLTEAFPFEERDIELQGWGIQHTISVDNPRAGVMATFEDGRPAIVAIPVGKGTVYYFATPLEERGLHCFFDVLYDELDIVRPTRTIDENGRNIFSVDSRTVATDGGYLTYVCNLLGSGQDVRLQLPADIRTVTNLSVEEPMAIEEEVVLLLSLARFETVLLKLE